MPTNIVSTSSIFGKTVTGPVLADGTTALTNPVGSNKVLRVGTLLMSNTTGSANADIIASIRRGGQTGASAMFFDGASAYLTLNSNNGLSFAGDFTIEAWVYINALPNHFTLLEARSEAYSQSNYLFYVTNNQFYRLAFTESTSTRYSNLRVYLQRWTHIAIARSSNVVSFYVDGVRDTSASFALTGTINASNSVPWIGRLYDGQYAHGYMNDLRVSQMARYSSDFTRPTTPFTDNDADTTLLLHGFGANNSTVFTDSVVTPHAVTALGDAVIKTTQSAFGGDDGRLAHQITVPAGGTLAVIAKENPIYLEEGDRLVCAASADSRIDYVCSYEEIS